MTQPEEMEEAQSQAGDESMTGPGAPTPLQSLEVSGESSASGSFAADVSWKGVAGLTKRDIQLIVEGGFNTVESVAYTPRRVLEQIKGISEQKASKILAEGVLYFLNNSIPAHSLTMPSQLRSSSLWVSLPQPRCTNAAVN